MLDLIKKIDKRINILREILENYLLPVYQLTIRIYLSGIFFSSGLGRLDSYLNGNWSDQLFLFQYEHPVPYLSPSIAASITTLAELILPILLLSGFLGRVGAVGILIMSIVIELTYMHSDQHVLWISMSLLIVITGAGKISLDHLINGIINKKQ